MLACRRTSVGPFGWRSTGGGAIAAIVVIALAASGCSGGSGKSVAVAATTTTTAPVGARGGQAFIQCMNSHGVPITSARGLRGGSTSTTLPAGVTSAQFQQALQACRSQLPTGGGNFQNNPAFAAYRNCLQLHGVTLPPPGSSTSSSVPGGGQGFGGLDRTNPTVQAALQACAALRPAGGPGGSTTTTPAA
jgi:hypothetical protein